MTEKKFLKEVQVSGRSTPIELEVTFTPEKYIVAHQESGWIGQFNKDSPIISSDKSIPNLDDNQTRELIQILANATSDESLMFQWISWQDLH